MSPTTIPLALLRPQLERGWPATAYEVGRGWRLGARRLPNGADARADLAQPAGSEVAFSLRGLAGARLRASVALADPDPGIGAHRVAVRLRLPSGESRTLWRGVLARLGDRVTPARRQFDLMLGDEEEAELVLSASADVVWKTPEIELYAVAPEPARPAPGAPVEDAEEDPPTPASPLISILMPVHDPPPAILEEAIASVREQTMGDWELCLADDGSADEEVRTILNASVAEEPRIKLVRRERAGGISAATNSALEIASGEYVALLDHDDTLVPDALAQVARLLASHPELDWVYSDEEVVADGVRVHAYLKPDWSPDLLRSQMYASHLGVYRRSLASELGFRSDFDGSQDYDFALRFSERTDRIAHIPNVLYSWRAHPGSVAGNPHSKPGAYPAAVRALTEHLGRTIPGADIHFGFSPGLYRVLHRVDPALRVGVVIAAERGAEGLDDLLANLADSTAAGLVPARIDVVGADQLGSAVGDGLDVVVLVDGPAIPLTRNWLARLVGFATQDGVGAVGPKLTSVNGLTEESGIAVVEGLPLPLMSGSLATEGGPLTMALLPSNVTAVGGVLATAARTFADLSGLDSTLGRLALPDFCLRAREIGLRTVLAPDAILRRPHGWAAVNELDTIARFGGRWARFERDPYFDLSWGWPGSEL